MYAGNYKLYLLVPALLFILFIGLIFIYPGIKQGIDLKGGTNIVVRADKELDARLLEPKLKSSFPLTELQVASISSPAGFGIYIQYSDNEDLAKANSLLGQSKNNLGKNDTQAKSLALQSIGFSSKYTEKPFLDIESIDAQAAVNAAQNSFIGAQSGFDLALQELVSQTFDLPADIKIQRTQIGPSLGKAFYDVAVQALVLGIILLSIVIFLYFREILTSVTVIAASLFNIVGAIALMSLFGITVSLTTIPALLMLIGYSVDTEIVMSARVLKRRENTPKQRMDESIVTIMTMSLTAIAAVGIMMIFSYFAQIGVIFEISAVLFFGLLSDLVSSSMMNAPLILMHAEKEAG